MNKLGNPIKTFIDSWNGELEWATDTIPLSVLAISVETWFLLNSLRSLCPETSKLDCKSPQENNWTRLYAYEHA